MTWAWWPCGAYGMPSGGTEVDAAGNRLARLVVHNAGVHPVPAPIYDANVQSLCGVELALTLQFAPRHLAEDFSALFHFDRCGGDRRHLHVGGAALFVLRFPPSLLVVLKKILRRLFRQRLWIGRDAPVYIHFQIERLLRILLPGKGDNNFPFRLPGNGRFISEAQGNAPDQEARTGGYHLQRLQAQVRAGILPDPEDIVLCRGRYRFFLS